MTKTIISITTDTKAPKIRIKENYKSMTKAERRAQYYSHRNEFLKVNGKEIY